MKNLLRTILAMLVVIICIKVVALFLFICYIGIFDPQEPNPLENIEQKLNEAETKSMVLTENEKELEKVATEKEWEEVDKDANK
tara:strand:- start:27703 stop:27954 length:252 start_codon:yes stop_codon:yes gene_type:complete